MSAGNVQRCGVVDVKTDWLVRRWC